MRFFVGLPIPKDVTKNISIAQNNLESIRCTKTPSQNFHLTLKFLGSVQENDLKKTSEILKTISANYNPFEIVLKGFGVFPSLDDPKVFFASTQKNKLLIKLIQHVQEKLQHVKKEEHKTIVPHITLARFSSLNPKEKMFLKKLMSDHDNTSFGTFTTSKMILYESFSTSQGQVYKSCKTFDFSPKPL